MISISRIKNVVFVGAWRAMPFIDTSITRICEDTVIDLVRVLLYDNRTFVRRPEMIQVIKRVIRVGDNGIVRVEVTLGNSRTGAQVILVTERPDLDAVLWVDGMIQEPLAYAEET